LNSPARAGCPALQVLGDRDGPSAGRSTGALTCGGSPVSVKVSLQPPVMLSIATKFVSMGSKRNLRNSLNFRMDSLSAGT
jgi:hypothetical protein